MSDSPQPSDPQHAPLETPSEEELARIAVPATARRAPRFGRVIGTGAWLGILIGAIAGFALPNSTGVGRGVVALLMALGLGALGALIAAVVASGMDGKDPGPASAPAGTEPAGEDETQPSAPTDTAADDAALNPEDER